MALPVYVHLLITHYCIIGFNLLGMYIGKSVVLVSCADPEGEGCRGSRPPPEKSHNIGFINNAGQDPLKNHKAAKPAFYVEASRAREMLSLAGQ